MKLITQIKARRKQLGLQQKDMKLRIGMNQQQYQLIEAGGNPRLTTLELIAEGLECELVLIPKNKIKLIEALLLEEQRLPTTNEPDTIKNPWSDVLD